MLRLLHKPEDEVIVQKFPRNIPPGDEVSVEIGPVEQELLGIADLVVQPPKRQPNQKRHERFTLIEMRFSQQVIAHELHVNLTTAEVFLIGQIYSALALQPQILIPIRSTLATYYARREKRKLLHAYFQSAGHPFISIERVFERYDRIYCMDTNTATNRNGQKVAVTTALTVKSKKLGEVAIQMGSDFTIQVVAHDPPPGNPELHGIWSVLGILVRDHPELVKGRLAIITDTEFGKLKAWNERTEPFYDGHMLPDDVDIFYATADAGTEEFMPNLLMKTCDTLCTKKLREVLAS